MSPSLPIQSVIPDIRAALGSDGAAVLIAPPGAGKTTAVAPALLSEGWCTGQIIITSPRRVAARAAAERMAETLGEKPGETVGYMTRLDTRVSAETRIIVMTEAILVNRLIEDPELPGVSAVLFDEAHERHLDSDLGLALALETRGVLREDLRVLVMSATIDGARFSRLLSGSAPVIESEGRSFPLQIEWLGSNPSKPIEDQVAEGIMVAWRDQDGDILAFLPGVREIDRVHERLANRLPGTPILPLHGQIEPQTQRTAIRRDHEGRRRIVLATAIAETSLTLDGVSVVVDSGLSRHAEFDRAAGTTHLVTHRASQAAATQRAGRAARQGPGVAYRLWEAGGHGGRPEFAPPEIEIADLAPLILKLAKWGATDPASLAWLDTPPEASVAAARGSLRAMGALDDDFRITPWGEKVAQLPLDPVSAAALLFGAEAGNAEAAAQIVVLMQERGLGGRSEDLLHRLSLWRTERGKRADTARKLARRWSSQAERLMTRGEHSETNPAIFLALARPDFVAKRRGSGGDQWVSVGGRGFQLDPASPLARSDWIVIADAQGQAKGARITAGAELSEQEIEAIFNKRLEKRSIARWNEKENRVEARLEKRLGAIVLASGPDPNPDGIQIVDILVDKAVDKLETLLPQGFLARAHFAGLSALSTGSLQSRADQWLAPLLDSKRDLNLPPHRFAEAAMNGLDWDERQQLEKNAPVQFTSPAGSHHAIDYAGDDAPSAEVRVQALFGLDRHPMIGETPLLLKLTSPAGRPIQSTRDLPGFWRGSWADVAKDMKGRYPKHRWPEKPWEEKPSLKTKNAFNRS
ncbi:ATP-dependent helicase HrpB [Erythrobacter insulae]|uniref:RNA helicase n=1 Tax=Erythrobacter insulae TaxID=2584124 RepID=A0A547P8P2_9SPHN|nr:ATP-dependent helicase HrpB [Erythrobacter insulae]TRD10473.1 ATP-dependent helicase HrpB [Erythrobacter insulae]